MKIGLLKLKNIGPFIKSCYNFDNNGITLIVGENHRNGLQENGVGKSMIPDAVLWVLYNKTSRSTSGKSIIHENGKNCSASIIISDGGIDYKIIRSYVNNVQKLFFYRIINGKRINLTEKIRETQLKIDQTFGTYDSFISSVYFVQDVMSSLLDGTPAKRMEIITSLFPSLKAWDVAREKCKAKIKEETTKLNEQLIEFKVVEQACTEFDSIKMSKEKAVLHKKLKKKLKRYENSKILLSELDRCNDVIKNIDILQYKLTSEKNLVNSKIDFIRMENEKYGDIKKIKYKIDNLKKRWRKLNVGENVGKFKDDKNFYLDEKKRLNKERDSLIKGVTTCQNNINQYKEKMKIGVCPFCDRKITNECVEKFELKMYESELRLKKFLTLKRKNESKLEKIELSIIEIENFISSDIERRNKIFKIDSDIAALYDQLDAYKNNENKIKLLKHDFYMFRKEILLQISKIKNTINIDIDGIKDKYDLVKEKVNIYNAEITSLKLEINNLKNKLRNYRSIKRKLSNSQVKIDLIQNNINIYDYLKNIFFKCKLHYINIINDKLKYHVTKVLSEINMDAEIDFVTSTNKVDSDVVIDKFDIIIKFKGKPPRDVKTFSAGEKRRFNVAVTISILEVIETFGNKWSTLILDEIFVNLDDIGMSLISSVINNLNKNIHIITLDLNSKKFYDDCKIIKIVMDEDGKSRIIKKDIGFSE